LATVAWAVLTLVDPEIPPPAPSDTGTDIGANIDFVTQVLGPILGTGLVGALFLMVLFRIKIMPTYVYDQAKTAWDTVHDQAKIAWDAERTRLIDEVADLKLGVKEQNKVYTEQVIPTLTRVLDAERELVDLRRDEAAERRRRGLQP
jgi:hypothetical protein